MKVINIGNSNIVVKDIRGNAISVAPLKIIDVSEKTAERLIKVYKFQKVEEVTAEVKEEKKEAVKDEAVDVEKVKKAFGKKAKAEKEETK